MNIFIVFQEAVYRHAIVGAFLTLEEAKAVADKYAATDDHHELGVIQCEIGKAADLVKSHRNGYLNEDSWPYVYSAMPKGKK